MKKLFFLIVLFICGYTKAQQLSQITFSYDGRLMYFTIASEQNLLLRISPEGQLLEFGTEQASLYNNNYYAYNLLPYPGRVDTYTYESDTAIKGKIKTIGFANFNWYASYEVPTRVGKLKSIGRLAIDYYDNFAIKELQGKIKSIGNMLLDYYSSPADDISFRGNLKSIGNIPLTYFTSFDDRLLKGKLKTIGSINYNWYGSFDINRSGLKSGNYRSSLNGILFIIR